MTVSPFKSDTEHFSATICFGNRDKPTSSAVQQTHLLFSFSSQPNAPSWPNLWTRLQHTLSPPGVGNMSDFYVSKCFWLRPEWIFWHHQCLCLWRMQIGEGQSELATLMMCCLTILSIAFITREVRVTGLNLLSTLVVHFLGMRMTGGWEVFENIPFIKCQV